MTRELSDELITIAPSLLAADFAALGEAAALVNAATGWLHLDVMDGHFVPNITIGPPVVAALRRRNDSFFDCHLMISEPSRYLEAFAAAGADLTTVHVEVGGTASHLTEMRRLGLLRGLALNPATALESVEPYLDDVDVLLCMTVEPGFGGQSFIAPVLEKVAAARTLVERRGLATRIEVDGGVGPENAGACAASGARVLVAGNSVFGAEDPVAAVRTLRAAGEAGAGTTGGAGPDRAR